MAREFTFDSRRLEASLNQLLELPAKRTTEEQVQTQMKGVVRTAADNSPPGGGGVRGVAAKRRGEKAITGDLFKVFTPTRSPRRVTAEASEIPAIHRGHRIDSGGGYGVRSPAEPIYVLSKELTAYSKTIRKEVGGMAGGLQPAAQALGFSLAKWLSRHSSSGSYVYRVTASGVTAIATNAEVNSGLSSKMEQVMRSSLDIQANKLDRMLEDLFRKEARRAGFTYRSN